MKKVYFVFSALFCMMNFAHGQAGTGTWTWISGSNAGNNAGVYGTQGTPAVSNYPPAIWDALEWKDKTGNFWMYGGTAPLNTDMWEFNPATLEWTWVKGSGVANDPTVFATKGTPNINNTPGQRSYTAATWVDTSGALWLMGGSGQHDDLWKYDIGTNMWTWVKGSKTNVNSVHGTMGTAAAANTPGNRYSTCSAWTDSANNLWLFGGWGNEDDGSEGTFNDLWKYNIKSGNWTWVKGSAFVGSTAIYGTKGIAAASNVPGSRFSSTKWKDASGNFWIMGGLDFNDFAVLNDVWKFDISSQNWIWMAGRNSLNDTGDYRSNCLYDTAVVPDAREENRTTVTDNSGRFWLFGGYDVYSTTNDLWAFNPTSAVWNLVKGPGRSQTSSYGTLGVSAADNMPPARGGAVAWWGNDNRYYMFGGQIGDNSVIYGDLWVFIPDTGCISFSNTLLPIELLSFNADYNGKDVDLNWSTASETNNNFFTVERAKDDADFAPVLNVSGAGTTHQEHNYYAKDEHPLSGISYYRLKQTDFDGHYTYSNIVAVKSMDGSSDYSLFPNPSSNMITVYSGHKGPTVTNATIYNMVGEAMLSNSLHFEEGRGDVIDVSTLSAGIYFLQLQTENSSVMKRFVKE